MIYFMTEGVTGSCGTGVVYNNYHMPAVNPDFQIIDLYLAYFAPKLSLFRVI